MGASREEAPIASLRKRHSIIPAEIAGLVDMNARQFRLR